MVCGLFVDEGEKRVVGLGLSRRRRGDPPQQTPKTLEKEENPPCTWSKRNVSVDEAATPLPLLLPLPPSPPAAPEKTTARCPSPAPPPPSPTPPSPTDRHGGSPSRGSSGRMRARTVTLMGTGASDDDDDIVPRFGLLLGVVGFCFRGSAPAPRSFGRGGGRLAFCVCVRRADALVVANVSKLERER